MALLVLSGGLGGCGFQPLYGAHTANGTVATELASIYIKPIQQRAGQQIRNRLISTMSPPGQEAQAQYRLELDTSEDQRDIFVQQDTEVRRRTYVLAVRYTLYEVGSNRLVHQGSAFSQVSFDRIESEFANVRVLANAQTQAAQVVADDIRTAVAAYFAAS